MCHAEQNAIFNAAGVGISIEGATIYTTKFPCLYCTNAIVQTGIQTIFTTATKTYSDSVLGDHGERVFHVLSETNVRIEAPNLKDRLLMVGTENGHHTSNGHKPNGRRRKS
jgi:deoxycytidylate deaminase